MELVLVMVLLGILSVFALPRFFDLGAYKERGFFDETLNAVRYAQKLAVARGCPVRVRFSSHGYSLHQPQPDCGSSSFASLPDSYPVSSNAESAVSISLSSGANNATFDALGRASRNMTVTVGSRSFGIVQETGFVDPGS